MTAKQNYDAGTKYFKRVPENIMSTPPSNVTIILTLPQRSGGEMYGM
jgi:hypothetical protein